MGVGVCNAEETKEAPSVGQDDASLIGDTEDGEEEDGATLITGPTTECNPFTATPYHTPF